MNPIGLRMRIERMNDAEEFNNLVDVLSSLEDLRRYTRSVIDTMTTGPLRKTFDRMNEAYNQAEVKSDIMDDAEREVMEELYREWKKLVGGKEDMVEALKDIDFQLGYVPTTQDMKYDLQSKGRELGTGVAISSKEEPDDMPFEL
jgi:replicative DNA helicase